MLTVFILASLVDERYVKEFWKSLVMLRRQLTGITWAGPIYVEHLADAHAVVPVQQDEYIVIGCMSNAFLAELMEHPAIRELVDGARRKVPLVVSSCAWNEKPCPFAGKMPLIHKALAESRQIDRALCEVAGRVREMLKGVA